MFEILDKVCLVIISALQGNMAPWNEFVLVDDDLGISVGQKPVEVVGRSHAVEIDQILNELIEWEYRSVDVKYHLSKSNLELIRYVYSGL